MESNQEPMSRSAEQLAWRTQQADEKALQQLLACEPVWVDVKPAREVLSIPDMTILHAGPPVSGVDVCTPIANSAAMAVLFEEWADDEATARRMISRGEVKLRSAQEFDAVVPLAAVLSPGMMVQVVENRGRPGPRIASPLNGGNGPALRLGMCSPDVVRHLRWLNGDLADAIRQTAQRGVPLLELANQGLEKGDDCHGRTPAATAILARQINADHAGSGASDKVATFLRESPSFFLNLWMAAAGCMLAAARGVDGSSMVTAIGANGEDFGVQISGLPGMWFTANAVPPVGRLEAGFSPADCLGAIGDSAVVDALGLGAMSLYEVPDQLAVLEDYMPAQGRSLAQMLMPATHPAFNAFKVHVGLNALRVSALARTPAISLGIIHKQGLRGRIGGGIYSPPVDLFDAALGRLQSGSQVLNA